jgi:hypothetical protein
MGAEPDKDENADPGAGVFGNLPSSRPGTRSPRRESATGGRPAAKPKTRAKAKAAGSKPAAAPRARRPDPVADAEAVAAATTPPAAGAAGSDSEPAPEGPAEESNRSGLEDIAWAGVAAAADAATIGVRLASRALERLRDGVDRR